MTRNQAWQLLGGPLLALLALLALPAGAAAEPLLVSGQVLDVTLDPGQGGSVGLLRYRNVAALPLQAPEAAGIAAQGSLFRLDVQVNEVAIEPGMCTWETVASDAATRWSRRFATRLESGLMIQREVWGDPGHSAFHIQDTCQLPADAAGPLGVRLGALSVGSGSGNLRCWFGDAGSAGLHVAPPHINDVKTLSCTTASLFWRTIDPLGIGMLYQVKLPAAGATVLHALSDRPEKFVTHRWESPAVTLKPGQSVTVEQTVTLDIGGRQGNNPSDLAGSAGTMLTVDLKLAADVGQPVPGAVTVMSATAQTVTLEVRQKNRAGSATTLATFKDLPLAAGRNIYRPFLAQAREPGELAVEALLQDAAGKELAHSAAVAIVAGDAKNEPWGSVWRYYERPAPQVTVSGTWREIGKQLAAQCRAFPPAKAEPAKAAETLRFYQEKFPFYAQMLEGAAEAQSVSPARLLHNDGAPSSYLPEQKGACMGIYLPSPSGPFQVYTQERGEPNLSGMAYLKVKPDQGYAYHGYTLNSWENIYGVNEKGLCTANASLYVDAATEAAGKLLAEEARAKGTLVAPLLWHMLLATCATVDEAIRFIENSEAPVEISGNYMISDRHGGSIVLQSMGLNRHIVRYDPATHPVFTCGNRSYPRADGQFQQGERPSWALNSFLKERFLAEDMGLKGKAATWEDALAVLHSHAAGGICQHAYENPGGLAVTIGFIANLQNGKFWLSYGPPCRSRLVEFTLE